MDCGFEPGNPKALLSDRRVGRMLFEAREPRTANYLACKNSIPIAQCHRLLNILVRAGLLERTRVSAGEGGRPLWLYRCTQEFTGLGHSEDNRVRVSFSTP